MLRLQSLPSKHRICWKRAAELVQMASSSSAAARIWQISVSVYPLAQAVPHGAVDM